MAKRRSQIVIDEDLDRMLTERARQTKRSKADLVRQHVREGLQTEEFPPLEEDPLWAIVGISDAEPIPVEQPDEFLVRVKESYSRDLR